MTDESWTKQIDHNDPYKDVPERMRDLEDWLPSVPLAHRALAGHELFGLKDQPMTPRHKIFIALGYAYARGRLTELEGSDDE